MLHVCVTRFDVMGNKNFVIFLGTKALFISQKNCKKFQIPRHIESYGAYMKY